MIPGSANPLLLGQTGTGDFSIERSLRFNSADSAYLNRTPSAAGNRKTFTFSCWVKRVKDDATPVNIFAAGANNFRIAFGVGTTAYLQVYDYNGSSFNLAKGSAASYRDFSAWYHIVVAIDTTDATADDRVKMYINGTRITDFYSTNVNPSQNLDTYVNNSSNAHNIGWLGTGNYYLDAYLAEVNFIDGQALDPTSFGQADANGVWQAKDTSGLTFGTNGFRLKFADNSSNAALGTDSSGNSNTWTVNNLSVGAVSNLTAKQNFDVVTYSGNSTARNIGGLAFTPDLVIIKSRSNSGYNHYWVDSVRGTNKNLYSNSTEATQTADRLSSFNSDGFGLTNHDGVNSSGKTYVAWAWKAGGAASSNTDGSGTTNVQISANTSYGFSIVTYTGGGSGSANSDSGDSFGHGLSSAPKLVICKRRNSANGWPVYHASTALGALSLNGTNALDTSSFLFAKKHPTSSVVYLGNNPEINATGSTYVAYCWSEIAGFSKISSYTGNGSSTGPVVTTGFKPRFLVVKRTDSANNWTVFDSARSLDNDLKWNTSEAEGSAPIEFRSDGFQIKNTYASTNTNGGTYVYMAFAATIDERAINDSFVDTPTNAAEPTDTGVGNEVVGNYCTLNPIDNGTGKTYSDGNLKVSDGGSGANSSYGTLAVSSGKWYWEIESGGVQGEQIGFADANASSGRSGNGANGWVYEQAGRKVNNNSYTSYGTSYADGDIIGIALDIDAGSVTFYKNGASQGVAFTGLSGKTLQPLIERASGYGMSWTANFGQRAFAHPLSSNPIYSQSVSGAVAGSPYDATKMFDGSLTTYADHNAQNSTITWTYTLTSVTSLRVYIHEGSSTGTVTTVGGNGTQTDTISANFGPGWHTISLSSTGSTINSIAFTRGGSGNPLEIYAIEVNGTVLVEGAGAIYKSLNTANLPTPTIADGSLYFDTKLYTGNNSTQSITMPNALMSPDFVWLKRRTPAAHHGLYDSVRGATKQLSSNLSDAESTQSQGLTSFDSNGFTLGNLAGENGASEPIVSWNWDAGSSTVSNTDGSITSQVRANPTAGFSIVTYTGTGSALTVGHGLNAAPEFLIVKNRTSTDSWFVYHKSIGATKYLKLETTGAEGTGALWSNTDPTSSVVSSSGSSTGSSGQDYLMLAFAPVEGYSAMGSYVGNGSSDGVFVHTGFTPSWLLFKRHDAGSDWTIYDTKRDPHNVAGDKLEPNTSDAESAEGAVVDILSNGFKFRRGSLENGGNDAYVYVAFASKPFASNGGLAR